MKPLVCTALLTVSVVAPSAAFAQGSYTGSANIEIAAHVMLPGAPFSTSDIEIEQELSRPYAYVDRRPGGFDIVSLKDLAGAKIIYSWRIENVELHRGSGSLAPTYLKSHGRYYFVNGFQFATGGPDHDLGAIVWDVTGLPDTSKIREVARVRVPEFPGGFHETFSYKHSSGQAIVFATTVSKWAFAYDIDRVAAGDPAAVVGRIGVPEGAAGDGQRGWHDFYAGYDPASGQDRFYAAGAGGMYVFDVTNLAAPRLVTTVSGVSGQTSGHTFIPTPDGRYAIGMPLPTYQYAVARVFDLKPGLDGQVQNISRPVGAWTPNWQGAVHNFEMRWPYVFIAGQDDALQVINLMDPTNPYTVGEFDTKAGPDLGGTLRPNPIGAWYDGVWGIDVRNADGLIVVSDYQTLRLSLKAHPVSFLRERFARLGIVPNALLKTMPNGRCVKVAGIVTVRQRPGSAKGVVFMTFEDETGIANAVVWPTALEAYRKTVMGARLVFIEGPLQSHENVIHVVARRLEDFSHYLAQLSEDGETDKRPHVLQPTLVRGHPRNARIIPKSRDFH